MVTFRAYICGPLDREWYNFAARSFHTKKLYSRLYSIEIEFHSENKKIAFWATIWGLSRNVRTLSIARWKAREWLPIRRNWNFFSISYGLYLLRLWRYKWKSVEVGDDVFRRGWVTFNAKFRRKGSWPTNHCWCQKARVTDCPFVW